MYVCRTLDSTVTVVARDEPAGEGVWEMIPAPSLFAEPSIPRHNSRLVGFVSGEGFFPATMVADSGGEDRIGDDRDER